MVLTLPSVAMGAPGLWGSFDPQWIPAIAVRVPGAGPGDPFFKGPGWTAEKIAHDTQEWAQPLLTEIGNANIAGFNALLNFMVLSQAGAVIGAMIQGGITIYSGIALREAEQTIKALLDDHQRKWAAIRHKMEEAVNLPMPSEESLRRAGNIHAAVTQLTLH
jgi:hypothetical protein